MKKFIIVKLIILFTANALAKEYPKVNLYTGNVTGVYFSIGKQICNIVNCEVKISNGSKDNIVKLTENKTSQLAIVQSDILNAAVYGFGTYKGIASKNIKAVIPLYNEAYTIVVRSNSSIKNFADLKGKKINMGKESSGMPHAINNLLKLYEMKISDFSQIRNLPLTTQGRALCKGIIDAAIYVVGHPNTTLHNAASNCQLRILSINDKKARALIKKYPFFVNTKIRAGTYEGNDVDINTIGVQAILVSSSSTPNDLIYNIIEKLADSEQKLREINPELLKFSSDKEIYQNGYIPYHHGADKFYKRNFITEKIINNLN